MAQGYITSITPKQTSAGTMYDFLIDGRSIGAGKFPPKDIKAGDYVNYEVEARGNYLNLKRNSMSKATPPTSEAPPAPQMAASGSTATSKALASYDAKDEAYSRGASLNSALAFVKILAASDSLPFPANAKKDTKADLMFRVVQEYMGRIYEMTTGRALSITESKEATDLAAAEIADTDWNEE